MERRYTGLDMMTRLAVALCFLMPWLAFGANIDFRSVNTNHFTTNGYRVSLRSIQTNETLAVAVTNIVTSLVGTGSVTLVQVTNAIGSAMTTSNYVYVDKAGDDSTGLINRRDRPFLNASNGAAVVTSGTTLNLGPGTYNVTPALVAGSVVCSNLPLSGGILWTNKANVLVRGEGRAVIQATTNGTIFFLKDCTNIVFDGVTFRGNHPDTNFTIVHSLIALASEDVKFFNCRFEFAQDHCIGPLSGDCERGDTVLIDGCTFYKWGNTNIAGGIDGAAIHPTVARDLRVVNSHFEDGVMGVEIEGYRSPTLTNQQNVQIEGNTFWNIYGYPIIQFGNVIGSISNRAFYKITGNMIGWDPSYNHPPRPAIFIAQLYDGLISGNTILYPNQEGIRIESTAMPTRGVIIRDNFIDSPALTGIGVYFTEGYVEAVSILDNTIIHGQKTSIEFEGSGSQIRGNRILNGNMEGGANAGIRLRDTIGGLWSNNVVERNVIGNVDGITNQAIGILIDAQFNNTRLSGNIYGDGITTKETDNGVGTTLFEQDNGLTGIGTSNPQNTLHVNGGVRVSSAFDIMHLPGIESYFSNTVNAVRWMKYDEINDSVIVHGSVPDRIAFYNSTDGGFGAISAGTNGQALVRTANGYAFSNVVATATTVTNFHHITVTNDSRFLSNLRVETNITAATYTGIGVINEPSVATYYGTNLTNYSFLMSTPGHLPTNMGLIMVTNSTASSNAIMLALATTTNTFQLYSLANGPSGYVLKPTNEYPYLVWAPDDTGGTVSTNFESLNVTNASRFNSRIDQPPATAIYTGTNVWIDVATNNVFSLFATNAFAPIFTNSAVAATNGAIDMMRVEIRITQGPAGFNTLGTNDPTTFKFGGAIGGDITGITLSTNAGATDYTTWRFCAPSNMWHAVGIIRGGDGYR